MKMICPKCKHDVEYHDGDCCVWLSCLCENSHAEALEAAEHRMHLTAFGAGLAVLILNDVAVLTIALVVIGGR